MKTLLVLLAATCSSHAFLAPLPATKAPSTTSLASSSMPPIKDISYGEASRKFRRTVYTHDDWKKHRNPDRFIYYLSAIFKSGVYKNIGREVATTTAIATFIWFYNIIVGGYTDLEGIKHGALISFDFLPKIGLPLAPFTLASPSLGLLLGTSISRRRFLCCALTNYLTRALALSLQSSEPTLPTNVGTKPGKTGE